MIFKKIKQLLKKNIIIEEICKKLNLIGGKTYIVGGLIRDLLLKKINKNNIDFDIEIHNLTISDLTKCLKKYGEVDEIGKNFGVLKIKKINAEFAIARTDNSKRKPIVYFNNISIYDSLRRRDITINSIAIEIPIKNLKMIDPFNGIKDINDKIIRPTNENSFSEDPLRLFRVMRYSSIYNLKIDKKLNIICKKIDIDTISKERIFEEIKKTFINSKTPSIAILWLKKINQLKKISKTLNNLKTKNFNKQLNFIDGNFFKLKNNEKKIFYIYCRLSLINIKILNEIFPNINKKLFLKINKLKKYFKPFYKTINFPTKKKLLNLKIIAYELNKIHVTLEDFFYIYSGIKGYYSKKFFYLKNYCKNENIINSFICPIIKFDDLNFKIEQKYINKILTFCYLKQIKYNNNDKDFLINEAIKYHGRLSFIKK